MSPNPLPLDSHEKAFLRAVTSSSRLAILPEEAKDAETVLDSDYYHIPVGSQG